MNFKGNQERYVNSKHLGIQVIKGSLHSGKTSSTLYRISKLKSNYCLYNNDNIAFIANNDNSKIAAETFYNSTIKEDEANGITLFSLSGKEVKFLSLNGLINSYFGRYMEQEKLILEDISEGDKLILLREVLKDNEEQINRVKTLKNSSVHFILDEIQWIKANVLSFDEYIEVNRKGRGKAIRRKSVVREMLYKLYTEYKNNLRYLGLIDRFDKVDYATRMVEKDDSKYIHIVADNCEGLTRGELNFIKALYEKKSYSSFTYVINNVEIKERYAWLKNGIKLNYLDDIDIVKNYRFATSSSKPTNEYSLEKYKYVNLKHRSEYDFLIDGASPKNEIIIDWNGKQEAVKDDELVEVPMYSDIAAGEPILMNGEQESNFYIPYNWIRGRKDNFVLHVKGDSMINADINDGDLVVIRRQNFADHNDIVAAEIEGSATLKRLNLKNKIPCLMPENPKYDPISLENREASILGIAIGIIKKTNKKMDL